LQRKKGTGTNNIGEINSKGRDLRRFAEGKKTTAPSLSEGGKKVKIGINGPVRKEKKGSANEEKKEDNDTQL